MAAYTGGSVAAELREAADLPGRADGAVDLDTRDLSPGPEGLPAGDALVLRRPASWAARLLVVPGEVVVTLAGRQVAPEDVRLEQLPSLRVVIEERLDDLIARVRFPPAHGPSSG